MLWSVILIDITKVILMLDLLQGWGGTGRIGWKRRQIPKWLYDNNRMWFGQNVRREQEGQYYSNRIWPWGQTSYHWSCSPLAELHHWFFALISISCAIINWASPQCHFDNVLWDISWATNFVDSIFKHSFEREACGSVIFVKPEQKAEFGNIFPTYIFPREASLSSLRSVQPNKQNMYSAEFNFTHISENTQRERHAPTHSPITFAAW